MTDGLITMLCNLLITCYAKMPFTATSLFVLILCYFSSLVTVYYCINVHFWWKMLPYFNLYICLLKPCHIQVSVSKARAIIVLAEDGNADQV